LSVVASDVVAPVVEIDSFESDLTASKKIAKGSSVITLVFTAIDLQVMPTGPPKEVKIGGSTTGVTLISNVAVPGQQGWQRQYTYTYTVASSPGENARIGYAIKIADTIGNERSVIAGAEDIIEIGMSTFASQDTQQPFIDAAWVNLRVGLILSVI